MFTFQVIVPALLLTTLIPAVVLSGIAVGRLPLGRIAIVGASGFLGFCYLLWCYTTRHQFDLWSVLIVGMALYMGRYAIQFWRYLLPTPRA